MARLNNHYELALESLMLRESIAYLPIDETQRAPVGTLKLKNPDFVIYCDHAKHLILEVKGRKVPRAGSVNAWATGSDAASCVSWQKSFGPNFEVAFAFIFQLERGAGHFAFRGREYEAWLLPARRFIALAHRRSAAWRTLNVRSADFRLNATPLLERLGVSAERTQFSAHRLDEIELLGTR